MTEFITPETLRSDPLIQHLIDILAATDTDDLILAGGFGLRLKQASIQAQIVSEKTLIKSVPVTRATQDLDLFLNLELWATPEKGKAVRTALDSLGYEVIPEHQNLQFVKDFDEVTNRFRIKVDLLARLPEGEEQDQIKFDSRRVGKDSGKAGTDSVGLHGRTTPEAFAVNDRPQEISLVAPNPDGQERRGVVLVPHPYASLNMKIKAAYDWMKTTRGEAKPKSNAEKHVYDVYAIVAMLLRHEIEECRVLVTKYAEHPIAMECQQNAIELFSVKNSPAFSEVRRQLGALPYDYETFREGLWSALGISESE